jgi:DNA (cytosine-5)-methyltransferase 1
VDCWHVARVFAHHWPDALKLGDIADLGWNDAAPIDVPANKPPAR